MPSPTAGTEVPSRSGLFRVQIWILSKKMSREFWIFFFAALFYEFGVSLFLFLYNLFLLDIGYNERQLGAIVGAMTLGGMIGTIPIGLIAQRAGLRPVLLSGFVLTAALLAARTVPHGERAQVVLAFLTGLCICCWAVTFSPCAAKLTTEKNRTFAFSLLMSTGISIGGVGGLVGGYLPGWLQALHPALHASDAKRAVMLLCCAVMVLGVWPASHLRLEPDQRVRATPWVLDPFLIRFLPAIALWNLASGAFVPFATVYLSRYVHVPLPHIGVISSAAQFAQVAAILIAPAVFSRFGLVPGIVLTQVATAVVLAGLAHGHALPLVAVLYLSFTAFHWMGGPGIYSLIMSEVSEHRRSHASAATNLVTSLSQSISAAAAGAAYVAYGYPAVLSALAGIALLAAALFWTLLKDTRHNAGLTAPVEFL